MLYYIIVLYYIVLYLLYHIILYLLYHIVSHLKKRRERKVDVN